MATRRRRTCRPSPCSPFNRTPVSTCPSSRGWCRASRCRERPGSKRNGSRYATERSGCRGLRRRPAPGAVPRASTRFSSARFARSGRTARGTRLAGRRRAAAAAGAHLCAATRSLSPAAGAGSRRSRAAKQPFAGRNEFRRAPSAAHSGRSAEGDPQCIAEATGDEGMRTAGRDARRTCNVAGSAFEVARGRAPLWFRSLPEVSPHGHPQFAAFRTVDRTHAGPCFVR